MQNINSKTMWFFTAMMLMVSLKAYAFDSGSTGDDGAFNPVVDTQLQLPADGIFHFTTVNIPSGITVRFIKNATNTPVTFLTSGDVTIDGSINLDGTQSSHSGTAGDGALGDDGLPGRGGPGGFDGGRGGLPDNIRGGDGLGPGGGSSISLTGCQGGSGGYATNGFDGRCRRNDGGTAYGTATLLPLIGGSGGGGGAGGAHFTGSGGGGGGGAILIASSATVTVNGTIVARGANVGESSGVGAGGIGGWGSGGAIRIVATTIAGNGNILAHISVNSSSSQSRGRIRLEAENITRTANTHPAFSFAAPGDVFVAGLPKIKITSVAGVTAPAAPTGNADIILPESTPNPVTVEFSSSNIPVGNTILLEVIPPDAAPINTVSTALTGTQTEATASAKVALPAGPSILQASTSFTVTAALGDSLSNFAMGERVEQVKVTAIAGQGTQTTFTTVSGKEFTFSSAMVAMQ